MSVPRDHVSRMENRIKQNGDKKITYRQIAEGVQVDETLFEPDSGKVIKFPETKLSQMLEGLPTKEKKAFEICREAINNGTSSKEVSQKVINSILRGRTATSVDTGKAFITKDLRTLFETIGLDIPSQEDLDIMVVEHNQTMSAIDREFPKTAQTRKNTEDNDDLEIRQAMAEAEIKQRHRQIDADAENHKKFEALRQEIINTPDDIDEASEKTMDHNIDPRQQYARSLDQKKLEAIQTSDRELKFYDFNINRIDNMINKLSRADKKEFQLLAELRQADDFDLFCEHLNNMESIQLDAIMPVLNARTDIHPWIEKWQTTDAGKEYERYKPVNARKDYSKTSFLSTIGGKIKNFFSSSK